MESINELHTRPRNVSDPPSPRPDAQSKRLSLRPAEMLALMKNKKIDEVDSNKTSSTYTAPSAVPIPAPVDILNHSDSFIEPPPPPVGTPTIPPPPISSPAPPHQPPPKHDLPPSPKPEIPQKPLPLEPHQKIQPPVEPPPLPRSIQVPPAAPPQVPPPAPPMTPPPPAAPPAMHPPPAGPPVPLNISTAQPVIPLTPFHSATSLSLDSVIPPGTAPLSPNPDKKERSNRHESSHRPHGHRTHSRGSGHHEHKSSGSGLNLSGEHAVIASSFDSILSKLKAETSLEGVTRCSALIASNCEVILITVLLLFMLFRLLFLQLTQACVYHNTRSLLIQKITNLLKR